MERWSEEQKACGGDGAGAGSLYMSTSEMKH